MTKAKTLADKASKLALSMTDIDHWKALEKDQTGSNIYNETVDPRVKQLIELTQQCANELRRIS